MTRILKTKLLLATTVIGSLALPCQQALAVPTADVLVVVDESLSMAGEQAWLGGMIGDLDTALVGAGVTGNRYGLIGFVENTAAHGGPVGPHKHLVGGADWGSALDFTTAATTLDDDGSIFEDGYEAVQFGIDNYTFRTGTDVAINIILVTDEDRDDTTGGTITTATIVSSVLALGARLNVVVNNPLSDGSGGTALGLSSDGTWYKADGAGGFTSGSGGTVGNGAGTTETDYINSFAFVPGIDGAAWDLNQLRAGGLTATSFTAAFIDAKVEEITEDTSAPVPLPGLLGLLGIGLFGMGGARLMRNAGRDKDGS